MLPGTSGFDVCRALRAARPAQAILMLTARGSEADVLEGFRCGADDYLTKPFSVAELVARVEALLRRAGATPVDPSPFTFGPWQVDPATRSAARDGARVELTAREVELLALFARARTHVSRRRLLTEPGACSTSTASRRARSTSTSRNCARRSAPASASRSRPCGAKATASSAEP
jgi:two-component system response regulator RegX3